MDSKNYLLPKEHPEYLPLQQRYLDFFNNVKIIGGKNILIEVSTESVERTNNRIWNEILLLAEHSAEMIELLMFSIDLKFEKYESDQSFYKPGEWQNEIKICRWIRSLGTSMPFSFFFLKDWDLRLHSVIGDLIEKPDRVEPAGDSFRAVYQFDKAKINIIDSRVGLGCLLFMQYCRGTGFDPKNFIEAIIAEFQVAFDYKMLSAQFEKDKRENVYHWGIINSRSQSYN